ncbi:MAG TPA: hypothetical protein VG621_01915 [Candidatus Paceibacterota bacterium]|nr:hypothetical protein [Candidatus Paceibacterota bacterium]
MTKRKKIISILIFLIIVAAFVFGVYWLVSRRQAAKTGTAPASFRQFLGFATTPTLSSEDQGLLSSQFTSSPSSSGASGTQQGGSSIPTATSQFTNDIVTPTNTPLIGVNGGENSGNSSTASSTGATGAPVAAEGSSGSGCTDADVNITFTPDELAQLQALQDRFYTVAQTLHTDADVATEEANYDAFTIKQQNLDQLLSFCKAATKNFTDPAYTNKVPTPFWYDPSDIRQSGNPPVSISGGNLFNQGDAVQNAATDVPLGYLGQPGQIGGSTASVYDSGAIANALRSIEQVLRLNLW